MAQAAGYSVLPISVSLLGINDQLRKELSGPTQKAAKQAGDSIRKGLTDGVDQASKNAEKANWRVKKSADELTVAESKLTEQKLKTEAANKAVESAARVRAEAEAKGVAAVEKAEEALLKKRAQAEKAARDLTSAESGVEKAMSESARAAESLEKRQGELDEATKDTEKTSRGFIASLQDMGDELEDTAEKSGGFGSKLMSGFGKIGTGALLGVGAKIGSTVTEGIGTAFSKGFGRLQSVEQAQTMLGGLGNSAAEVESIMDSAMESVSGTAYGFGEAASMAATFSGAGIKDGKELTNVLTLVGDTAAIAGADFNEMGSIWTKVATGQKLQTSEMNQLMDRGLGVLPELQKHYGVTADEARKMVTDGKVSFEDFSEVMENMVGGSAQAMGETFSGSAANMQAALGRLGAKFLDPIYENAPAIFSAIGGAVDTLGEHLSPLIEGFSEKLTPVMEDFAERLGPWLEESIDKIATTVSDLVDKGKELVAWGKDNRDWIEPLAVSVGVLTVAYKGLQIQQNIMAAGGVLKWLGQMNVVQKVATGITKAQTAAQTALNVVMRANPIGLVVTAVAALAAGLTYFFTKTETGQELWSKFTGTLSDGWDSFVGKIQSGWEWISGTFESIKGAWGELTSAFTSDSAVEGDILGRLVGEDRANNILGTIQTAMGLFRDVKGYITGVWDILFKGDYTGLPFGLDEDSGLVNFFFNIREAAIKAGEIIGNVWDGIVTAGKVAVAVIGTLVLTPLLITWNALSDAFKWGWESVIKPVWDAMSAGVTWLWENGIKPALDAISEKWDFLQLMIGKTVFEIRLKIYEFQAAVTSLWMEYVQPILDLIRGKWDELSTAMAETWESIKTSVFDAFNWYIDRVKANWELVTGAIVGAWTWVKDTFISIWESIKTAVFDAWNSNTLGVKTTFEGVTTALSDSWTWVKDQFSSVWDWIRDNVFAKFSSTIDLMRSGAETAMDGIGKAFDWLREKTAKPVNFVIETVYMNGIREAWGAVANLVDLDPLPEVKKIGGFAEGTARVPGARTRHDNMHMMSQDGRFGISLRGGEGVVVPEVVDALGEGTINRWNSIAMREGAGGVARSIEHMGRFSDGGFVDIGGFNMGGITNLAGNLSAVQQSHARFVGRFFPELFNLTSATRFTDSGHHSTGKATDWQGKDGQFATQMPSPASKGLSRAIFTNFPNSAELIHHPLDGWQNLSEGAPYDFGPGTNADHGNHVHWATHSPLQFNGDDIVLSDVPGGGIFESIASLAKKLWDPIISKVPKFDGGGLIGGLPGAFLGKAGGAAWDWIKGKAESMLSFFGSSGGGAEQWRGLASQALKRMGYDDRYLDAMVQQIQIESTGDPNAVNNWDSNALRGTPSRGLLQVIDPTYRDVRNRYPSAFEGLPDDSTHPLTNLTAGVGAVKRDWGGPGGRWPTVDGYHNGGLAGVGQGWMKKTAMEPEMILSPATTQAFIDWMKGTPSGESMQVVAKELRTAFDGGDWGYGELAHVLRNEAWAKAIVNGVATLGVISRDTDFIAANAELQQTAADAGRGFLEAQATSLLDVVGLGGLVSMGSSLWDEHGDQAVSTAHSLFGATQNPDTVATASFMGQRVTLEFNAESLDDVVRIGDLKAQADRIDGLEVQLNTKRRPPAGMVTRGGAM